jgi:hypothetical protein
MSIAPPPESDAAERRIAPRRQPAMGTVCRLVPAAGQDPPVGLVWNISATGVSMLLHEPPATGTQLLGVLETMTGGTTLAIAARVVHVKQLETGDYFLGAHFHRPLTTDDLKPFVE